MEYFETVKLKDGRTCVLRNGTARDAAEVIRVFALTHAQTDYLLSYPDENVMTVEKEAVYLQNKTDSGNEIEILAEVDGVLVGLAGISCVGAREKIRHRAEFGISVDRACWGVGIGRALMNACIECAKRAGYVQMELSVVAENEAAIALYKSVGFTEFGRNPKAFRSRCSGWQELVDMRKELTD